MKGIERYREKKADERDKKVMHGRDRRDSDMGRKGRDRERERVP